ncbi:MAG: hypothetical protein DHS20C14_18820 [Phycisphaeraceae bacterium]|nr:MAG: hypothetical protein DHS20C14_18820 [Phycisphaeraceae bacterium]
MSPPDGYHRGALATASAGGGGRAPATIRAFVTDGSLAAFCAELGNATGTRIRLRDERGLVLSPWGRGDEPGLDEPLPEGAASVPLVVDGERIGALTVEADGDGAHAQAVRTAVDLLAHVACELCTDVVELRTRVTEVRVLSRLSAMLADGGSEADALTLAIDAGLEALGLDAGSIMLLPEDADGLSATEDEQDLRMSVARSLSETWLGDPAPLSRGRQFDRLALSGEVVTSEDLATDDRVLLPQRCRAEGLASYIGAGLIYSGRPIGVMRLYARTPRAFSAADRRLIRSIGQQAAAAVEQARLHGMRERERRVQRSLQVAAEIQRRMLARHGPEHGRLETAARYVPSTELAGDFYDLFDVEGGLGVAVGDVVGKGVGAALLMSAVRASLRAYADSDTDPARVMTRVNEALCRDTTVQEFATVWFGIIDPETLGLTYASAGHDPPVIVTPSTEGSHARRLEPGGLVAGVNSGEAYQTTRVQLAPGDALVVYTDGMIDARSFDGERLGRDRFEATVAGAVEEAPDGSAQVLADRLMWAVRRFAGLAPQTDDQTIAVVRVR